MTDRGNDEKLEGIRMASKDQLVRYIAKMEALQPPFTYGESLGLEAAKAALSARESEEAL